jgi:chaperonin GroES
MSQESPAETELIPTVLLENELWTDLPIGLGRFASEADVVVADLYNGIPYILGIDYLVDIQDQRIRRIAASGSISSGARVSIGKAYAAAPVSATSEAADPAPNPKLKPLADRVVVRPIKAEAKSAGGILLPGKAQDKPQEGEVIAVGPGLTSATGERIPLTVRPGDRVLFSPYAGTDIQHAGEQLKIIAESDLLAVVE